MPRGGAREGSGRPKHPGCRQVSFWTDETRVKAYDRHAKRAGLSRSEWLGIVADRAVAKAEK